MPARAASICRAPSCGRRIATPGYCETHAHLAAKWSRREGRAGSTTQRGYGWQWQKKRERILERDGGLCQPCVRLSRVTEAKDVDHIVSKANGGSDDDDNLQSICLACHKAKTARERQP